MTVLYAEVMLQLVNAIVVVMLTLTAFTCRLELAGALLTGSDNQAAGLLLGPHSYSYSLTPSMMQQLSTASAMEDIGMHASVLYYKAQVGPSLLTYKI